MTLDRILPFTKYLLEKCVKKGDFVVDATSGNGNDTLFLSQLVDEDGHVLAFDIQEAAIAKTKLRLIDEQIKNVTLVHDGHENVRTYTNQEVAAAIFNLGYLPGSDEQITTNSQTTWKAVTELLQLLRVGGVIILVIYHGHPAGQVEKMELERLLTTLESGVTEVLRYEFLNKSAAPYVVAIERRR